MGLVDHVDHGKFMGSEHPGSETSEIDSVIFFDPSKARKCGCNLNGC